MSKKIVSFNSNTTNSSFLRNSSEVLPKYLKIILKLSNHYRTILNNENNQSLYNVKKFYEDMSYNQLIKLRNDLNQLIILIRRNMRQMNNATSSAAAASTSPQGNTVVRITNYNNNTLFEVDDRYLGLLQYFKTNLNNYLNRIEYQNFNENNENQFHNSNTDNTNFSRNKSKLNNGVFKNINEEYGRNKVQANAIARVQANAQARDQARANARANAQARAQARANGSAPASANGSARNPLVIQFKNPKKAKNPHGNEQKKNNEPNKKKKI